MTAGAIGVPTIVPLRAPMPGQHKTCIDSNTKIEITSDTPGVSIYFTINGKNPAPFQKHGPEAKSTLKYRETFRLPAGKRTVKAVAVSEDGTRDSFVVTKTFEVEGVASDQQIEDDNGYRFMDDIPANEFARKEVKKFANSMVNSRTAWNEIKSTKRAEDEIRGSSRRTPGTGPKYLGNRMGNTTPGRMTNGVDGVNGYESGFPQPKRAHPDTATQALRLQRETDFLKCIYCFSPRPSDPYARFCNDCGNPVPPIPQTRMPPPESGQMGTCVHCKSLVPFNTTNCLICEASIPPQNQPMASVRLADKLMCLTCGTANPANLTTCVTCEARLPVSATPALFHGSSAPPFPKKDGRLLTCTKCGRVNNPDARYCDWCGIKPSPASTTMNCSKCRASNHAYSKFCGSCGVVLEPPQRAELRNSGLEINRDPSNPNQWVPITMPLNAVPKVDISTQTVGLFYKSSQQIDRVNKEEEEKEAMEKMIRDRKPLMTAISPGRGYWRKQMEHMCTHLKAHAQNNAEFRALIGEPRMGKIISTAVHEDGYELSVTVNFALRGNKDPFMGEQMSLSKRDFLSSYTNGRKSSLRSYGSEDSLVSGRSTNRSTKRGKKRTTKKTKKREDTVSIEQKKLLKELSKNGSGDPSEVHKLIEEGADPAGENKDGVPLLTVAAKNKHIDAIPVLVQEGAEVNTKGPNRGNTALHEAVSMGPGAKEVLEVLLSVGADPKKKNDKGESPYDLAVNNGFDSLAHKLTATLGQNHLSKMIKPKSNVGISDEF